jgi:hypothetical protein
LDCGEKTASPADGIGQSESHGSLRGLAGKMGEIRRPKERERGKRSKEEIRKSMT